MVNEFSKSGFNVITTLHKDFSDFKDWLSADRILDQKELEQAIEMDPDAALVVAPNSEGELEKITNKLKRNNIPVMGSSKYSLKISRDKWKTYQALEGIIPQPDSWETPPDKENTVIVKPKSGTGCEGVTISHPSQIDAENGKIYQDYKEGIHASCCLLAKEEKAIVLSLNKQFLNSSGDFFRYEGGYIPLEDRRKEKCIEISSKVVENLDLNGYCGIDFVLGEKSWFIEVNPRVTTSFVGLAQNIKSNLGEMLVDTIIKDNFPSKPELKGYSTIRMPRLERETKVDLSLVNKLKEIPEIVSPPSPVNSRLQKGAPIFLAANCEDSLDKSREKLRNRMKESLDLLGVDRNDVSWS